MIHINASNAKQEKSLLKNMLLGISDVFCLYKKTNQHRVTLTDALDVENKSEPKSAQD
jgi:hypothetical protein